MPNSESYLTLTSVDRIDAAITGPRTRRVWTYWRQQAGAAPAPGWTGFNLMDVYRDAPCMLVLDVLPETAPVDYRYRFVGTVIVHYRWKLPVPDHTGLRYSETQHQYDFREVKACYDRCAESGQPVLMRRDYDVYDASGVHERLVLPLIGPDGETEKLAVILDRLSETKKSVPDGPPRF